MNKNDIETNPLSRYTQTDGDELHVTFTDEALASKCCRKKNIFKQNLIND